MEKTQQMLGRMSEKGKIHRGNLMKLKNCDYSLKKNLKTFTGKHVINDFQKKRSD